MPEVPFVGQAYELSSKPLSAQRCVNWYVEANPDSYSGVALQPTAGTAVFSDIGGGPTRGEVKFLGGVVVVVGTSLYTIDAEGTATSRGTVPGSGAVGIAENGVKAWVTNGTTTVYTWDGTTFASVTGMPANFKYTIHLDRYALYTQADSGRVYISDLGDPTTITSPATQFFNAESYPDATVVLFNDHRELWLFGETSIEIWYNAGTSPVAFRRQGNTILERGCKSAQSVAKEDNTLFWLGDDLIIYRANGYVPQRVSTHAIESAIAGYANPDQAKAFTFTENGHKFYQLNFDEASWVYDMSTGFWHERSSSDGPHVGICAFEAFGKTLLGSADGIIYDQSLSYDKDGTEIIKRMRRAQPLTKKGQRIRQKFFEIHMETGTNLTAMLRWSDDGGRTWSNEHWRSTGAIGDYEHRVIWRDLGSFVNRIFELSFSEGKPVVYGASAA